VARERRDGELTWIAGDLRRRIFFVRGRPERVIDHQGKDSKERHHVITMVRALATATAGQCRFAPSSLELGSALDIDTLGETLVALARGLHSEQLEAMWSARRAEIVDSLSSFERFAAAVVQVGGARVVAPSKGITIAALIAGKSKQEQRTWAALLSLGAVKTSATSAPADAVKASVISTPEATETSRPAIPSETLEAEAPSPSGPSPVAASQPLEVSSSKARQPLNLPENPEARVLALEIEAMHRRLPEVDYYQILEVSRDAPAAEIRSAYFKAAKRWHSDRFKGHAIGEDRLHKVEEIFRYASEAREVLCDTEKRKSYDFIQERKAQGLPTDVKVILEAEGLFHRAQSLVRRGQAAAAAPLLRQAIELNPGEAEFWAYLGFAVYSAQGKAGVVEAREAITRALQMSAKLDVAHEFLGRMARSEGQMDEARRELRAALEINPRNVDAQRELRLVNLRSSKAKSEPSGKGIGDLLGGLFKK
jgi:curved DNA-binding protein CbpA